MRGHRLGRGRLPLGLLVVSLPLALLCLALAGAADVLSTLFRTAIIQAVTPDGLRGRVGALRGLFANGGPRVGDIEATAVAAVVGAQLSALERRDPVPGGGRDVTWRFPELDAYVRGRGPSGAG